MTIDELPYIMVRCLLLTIIVETIVAIALGVRNKKDILNIILVNIVTNPIVVSVPVYFNVRYGVLERNIILSILEIATVITEGYVYKKVLNYKKINYFILSLILNIASCLVGIVINNIL